VQINMNAVHVRFVSDAKGPLEDKPKSVVLTLAVDHEVAIQHARAYFAEVVSTGVVLEYSYPHQLFDTLAIEALVYA